MSIGPGVIAQARLRPLTSGVNQGAGINYGMGTGSVRIAGVTYSVWDASGLYVMAQQAFVLRVAIVNGDYPQSAEAFVPSTDLSAYNLLFDEVVSKPDDFKPLWQSGLVTDEGLKATALISQLVFPAGPPAGIEPVSILILHGDHYQTQALALSPGSIFHEGPGGGSRGGYREEYGLR